MNWMFKDRTRVYATHGGHALFPSNTNSPSSEAFSDMAIMSIAVQNLPDPLGVQNCGMPNRLGTGPLVWSRTGLMLLPSSRLGAVCQRPREVMRVQNLTLDSARKRVSVTLRRSLICYHMLSYVIVPWGGAGIMLRCRYICYRTGAVMRHVEQKDLVATDSGRDKGSKIRPRFDYREERLDRQVS